MNALRVAAVSLLIATGMLIPSGSRALGLHDLSFDLPQVTASNLQCVLDYGATTARAGAALGLALDQGLAYIDTHARAFPSNEVQGRLLVVVPEPGTGGLFALGIAGIALAGRRRR